MKDDVFYLFDKRQLYENKNYVLPNEIIKFHENQIIIDIDDNLNVPDYIKKDKKQTSYVINLISSKKSNETFNYLNIEATILKYNKNAKYEVLGVKNIEDNVISITGYEIIKIKYYNVFNEKARVEKIFFFAPLLFENFVRLEDVVYEKDTLKEYPHCKLDAYSFGYLHSVWFGDENVMAENLIQHNNFIMKNDAIYYMKNNSNGILKCIYKTPVNEYYVVRSYIAIETHRSINRTMEEKNIFEKKVKIHSSILLSFAILVPLLTILVILLLFHKIFSQKESMIYDNMRQNWKKLKHFDFNIFFNLFNYIKFQPFVIIVDDSRWIFNNKNGFIDESYENVIKSREGEETKQLSRDWPLPTDRRYYLCEVSTKYKINLFLKTPHDHYIESFWEEIIKRNITTIFYFRSLMPEENDYDYRYNNKLFTTRNYGSYSVTVTAESKESNTYISYKNLTLISNDKGTYFLKVYTIENWDINTPPVRVSYLYNLYSKLTCVSNSYNVLIYANLLPDSRVSLLVSYIYVIEVMKNDPSNDNFMIIIKTARKFKHIGPLSDHESIYLLESLLKYFVSKKILKNGKNMRRLTQDIDNYFKSYEELIECFPPQYDYIYHYIESLSDDKIKSYYGITKKFIIKDEKEMQRRCSYYYDVYGNQLECSWVDNHCGCRIKNKHHNYCIRYKNIPFYNDDELYDAKSNFVNEVFIPGNLFKYRIFDSMERKLILCQSPMDDSINNIVGIIYEKGVNIVVFMDELLNNEEEDLELTDGVTINESYREFFPNDNSEHFYGDYVIKKRSETADINQNLQGVIYSIRKINSKVREFKYLTFTASLTKKAEDHVEDYMSLILEIEESIENKCLMFYDHTGISTAAIMTFTIFLLDVVSSSVAFDPVTCLQIFRKKFCTAIRNDYHFLFSILLVICKYNEPFKNIKNKNIERVKKEICRQISFLRIHKKMG
uniref:Tyrosine-protein phosphatase domain-containing protein n=1 Tax=Parastrongyloides trichosuri TaxID=131310 RepID=A0A0N4ZNU0_PARTI